MSCTQMTKDPNAVLDYTWDWSRWLPTTDTITGHQIIGPTPAGLVVDASNHTGTSVIVWLSGGSVGITYTLTCQIVTAQGRTADQQMLVLVNEQ